MRRSIAVSALLLPGLLTALPAFAQSAGEQRISPTGRTISSTGQTMPPALGPPQGQITPTSQEQMLKAQRAAQERDKAWDAKMNRTMGSICKGC
ncbi:MAG: hypothetical protein PGN25_08910 [Methylorubrum populi]